MPFKQPGKTVKYSQLDIRPRNNNPTILSPHAYTLKIERICEECGNSFHAKTSTTQFRSPKCNRMFTGTIAKESPKKAVKETITATLQQDLDLLPGN